MNDDTKLATITTREISDVSDTSVSSGGTISSDGGARIFSRGVCYSTLNNPTLEDSAVTSGTGKGDFVVNISGLSSSTTYYLRAYAINAVGVAYGNEVSFTTNDNYSLPSVNTLEVTSITINTASVGAQVVSDGGVAVSERGICYSGISVEPTIQDNKISDSGGIGTFSIEMANLAKNTTYHVRAYAINKKGVAYGSVKSFTTPISSNLALGDFYAGGFIFYIDETGEHGLVVSDTDIPLAAWGCEGVSITTSETVGSGAQNTKNIVANCRTAGIVAESCDKLVYSGYDDWYLPSIDEFQLIYDNIIMKGKANFVKNSGYWTSTEQADITAFGFDVMHASPFNSEKSWSFPARAVRSF